MAKTKTTKSMLKGVAAGFACLMCCAFFPANLVANAADYTGDTARTQVSRIEVYGNNKSLTVKEGESFVIPSATYNHNGIEYDFGSQELADAGMESSIEVVYKGTGEIIAAPSNTFVASKVGTYVITYKVVRDGIPYTYELSVVSQATTASFDFEANSPYVIPTYYDPVYAEEKGITDISLPLPSVKGEGANELLSNEVANFTLKDDGSDVAGNMFVKISLTNGGEGVKVYDDKVDEEGNKVFYIKGSDIAKITDDKYEYEGRTFKVVYSFYQKVDGENIYVASTSKSFTVKSNYYYKTSEKKERGYDLEGVFATTFPDSAIVGVTKTLPGIVATTTSKNTPAGEAVPVHYQIEVKKMDENGKYTIDANNTIDGNEFTADDEGSYKFIYTAVDFYGNPVDSDSITRTIKNVKDTISAKVFMYDAKKPGYNEEDKTYADAQNLLKTKSANRNVIIYAIGGTDNWVANDKIELRREIRAYSGTTAVFKIDQKEYHAYNLVFAPTVSGDTSSMSDDAKENALYKQIVDENFALRSQMILDGKDAEDPTTIKEYMKGSYLLVTTKFNEDAFGKAIVEGLTAPDAKAEDYEEKMAAARQAMMEKGYAYIPAQAGQSATLENKSYTVRYFANDNVNTNTETIMPAKEIEFISNYTDESVPTLTFSSSLQASYLPTDTFTFNVAAAEDVKGQDNRLSAVTAYRYLDKDKAAIESSTTAKSLSYYVQRYDTEKVSADKWYATTGKTPAAHADNWFVDTSASSYTINLNDRPEGAEFVEIFAYATDDYGNTGFFNKIVEIANATDEDMPTLSRVINAPDRTFTAPEEIKLPTLTFTDSKTAYMTAEVDIYKIIRDGEGNYQGKTKVSSRDKNATPNSERNTFTVSAGYFRASVAGEYQVAITAKDAGNHSVTTFFTYTVAEGTTEKLAPTIDNISSAEESLKPGVPFYLDPPSISMTKDDAYGYIGLDEDDETNTATYYNVNTLSATTNDYEIENNTYFTAYSEGTYKLQYTAYLMKYKKDALADAKTDGKLFFGQDSYGKSKLKYFDGTKEYFVYLDETEGYAVRATENLDGTGAELNATVLEGIVDKHVVESDAVITITVSAASLAINDTKMDLHYKGKTEFELNEKIEIIKPFVEFDGEINTDTAASTVTITRTNKAGALATIYLNKWNTQDGIFDKDYFEVTADGRIFLIMTEDAKYTISYSVKGTTSNAKDTYEVTVSAGDVVAPELELGDDIVADEYKVGENTELNIYFDSATLDDSILSTSDLVTSVQELLKSLKVEIKYENGTYTEVPNTSHQEGVYNFIHSLDKAGKYTISFTVTDVAGNKTTKYKEIEVKANEAGSTDVSEVMGGVLIGLSVALLAGVVLYFVVSKRKLDKKEKSYRKETKRK